MEELWKDMEKEVSNLKSDARRETAFVEKMFSDLEEQLSNLSVQKELIDQRKDRKKVQDNLDYFINELYEDNQVKNRNRRGRLEDHNSFFNKFHHDNLFFDAVLKQIHCSPK